MTYDVVSSSLITNHVWFFDCAATASSYYPHRGQNTHDLAYLDPEVNVTDTEDDIVETAEDWIDDEPGDSLAPGPSRKYANEVRI